MLLEAHEQLLRRDGEIETLIHDLQADLAAALPREAPDGGVEVDANDRGFLPGKYFRYRKLVRRIREVARTTLPPGAIVVVVSRGDEALLELGDNRQGWHFPQDEEGVYAGHYPPGSAEAIAHLEKLRVRGGEFLLLPATSFWWLEHYSEFRQHLDSHYKLSMSLEDTCLIFTLHKPETDSCGECTAPINRDVEAS